MASTTKKHRDFVSESMKGKDVTDLPGIGEVYGKRLHESGYVYARHILGMYLTLREDEQAFRDFLKNTCGASSKSTYDCYKALKDWCDHYI
ncbi:putative barrier to autointegration factor [Trypoxylus dichotomus]